MDEQTLSGRLLLRLGAIEETLDDLLDASSITFVPDRALHFAERSGIMVPSMSDGVWGPSDDRQRQLQRQLLGLWTPWLEQLRLLFSGDTLQRRREINGPARLIEQWIQRSGGGDWIPHSTEEAKQVFRKWTKPLRDLLGSLGPDSASSVSVLPDTNVLIRSPDITGYGPVIGTEKYTVLLVPGVLAEIDAHKVNHKVPAVREKARKVSDRIKGWRNQGNLAEGVRVQGDIWVRVEGREPDFTKTLSWLRADHNDDRVIASLLEYQRLRPTERVCLLTGDTLMLAKADMASIPTLDTPDPEV
jgi:hypothetical protein